MKIDIKKQVPILVGRFSPLHNGHCELIDKAISIWPCLIIAVGVSMVPIRMGKTPFISLERVLFVHNYIKSKDFIDRFGWRVDNIQVSIIKDVNNAALWMNNLEEKARVFPGREPIFIIGRPEDTTFYNIPRDDGSKRLTYNVNVSTSISATMLRERLSKGEDISEFVHPSVHNDILVAWKNYLEYKLDQEN